MPETVEMSFIRQMKDKTRARDRENVFHRVDEGQNACHHTLKCPSLG